MKYSCDGGTIMIGNESCRACIPNGYGDGDFPVKVVPQYSPETKGYEWHGTIEGDNLKIYEYDCLKGNELYDGVLKRLKPGRYAIYSNNGKILLEKWE